MGLQGQQIETQQLSSLKEPGHVCVTSHTHTHTHTYSQSQSPSRGPRRHRTHLLSSLRHHQTWTKSVPERDTDGRD